MGEGNTICEASPTADKHLKYLAKNLTTVFESLVSVNNK